MPRTPIQQLEVKTDAGVDCSGGSWGTAEYRYRCPMRDLKPREYALLCEASHAVNGIPNRALNSLVILDGHPDILDCVDMIHLGVLEECPRRPRSSQRGFRVTPLGYSYLTFFGKSPSSVSGALPASKGGNSTASCVDVLNGVLGVVSDKGHAMRNTLFVSPESPEFFRVVDMVRQGLIYVSEVATDPTLGYWVSVSVAGMAYYRAVRPSIRFYPELIAAIKAAAKKPHASKALLGVPELSFVATNIT